MQVPIGVEASLKGVVDLIKMKAVVWKNEDLGAAWELVDIPEDLKEISNKYRQELVETAVEQDEQLMESYLAGKDVTEQDLIKCIRKGCLGFDFVPVLTGSAFVFGSTAISITGSGNSIGSSKTGISLFASV